MIETADHPAGHPAYRRICQAMHRLIAEQAGHRASRGRCPSCLSDAGEGGWRRARRGTETDRG